MRRIVTAIALAILASLVYILGWSNYFSVSKVTIDLDDTKVVAQVQSALAQPPAALRVGEKLARVDKRVINSRLRNFLWVDRVSISRNFFSGEVRITITPREPIARFAGAGEQITFLSSNLEIFTLDRQAVVSAQSTGATEWKNLPVLTASNPSQQTLEEVKTLIDELARAGLVLDSITTSAEGEYLSTATIGKQTVEIRWGSVQELATKKRVLDALLAAPENNRVKKIDLSNPINPTVK